ncbi:MAG TPA: alpha/beta hydrolase, partial [Gaiellales bacterium]|nr:alpha/beta hydrolase [Gaiellales bacterium]
MTDLLHVHRYGPTRPPQILAVHGLTGHGQRWQTLATRHLPEFAIVAPDLIGHGRSSWEAPWNIDANVDALARLLDTDAEGPVVVVGHSFGGAVALNLAAARPDLVSALVLLDPAVGLDGGWMRDIADDMFALPDYTDREEARAEKVNGSWGEVDAEELDRELDEHLIDLPNGRVGWRLSISAMMSYWSELARPIRLPHNEIPITLVLATKTDPPYVTEELLAR